MTNRCRVVPCISYNLAFVCLPKTRSVVLREGKIKLLHTISYIKHC